MTVSAPPTTTDRLKAAVCKALEKRRSQIDSGLPLISVQLVVKIDPKTGRPRELLYRSEESDDLRTGLPG